MANQSLPHGRFFGRAEMRREIGGLVLVESHHAAGSRLPRHSHERAYFCLNVGGTYVERYGCRRRSCRTGMLVFHPPGESHEEDHHSAVDLTLARIAADAGFADQSHFTRTFKRFTGLTPSDYRTFLGFKTNR